MSREIFDGYIITFGLPVRGPKYTIAMYNNGLSGPDTALQSLRDTSRAHDGQPLLVPTMAGAECDHHEVLWC